MSEASLDHHYDAAGTDIFGFWIYIMTDCLLFASLFATFIVLTHPNAYGPPLKEFIDLKYVLGETFFLLGSNFTFGLAILSSYKMKVSRTVFWLIITFFLGAAFVGMEINEFINLYHEGFSWHTSGAASAFFTLVGTHGLHVSMGLLWIVIMMVQLYKYKVVPMTEQRLAYLGLFWNFLEIVWIFIFSIVYLRGVL